MEKIINYFAKNKLMINLLLVLIFVTGYVSTLTIKQEAVPSVDTNKMRITVTYPGASPNDVEINAVIPIEEELKNIYGIEEYTSVCKENTGIILVELDDNIKEIQPVKDEVYRTISKSNIEDIPDEVDEIQIMDINPKHKTVYSVSISPKDPGKTDEKQLFAFIDTFEKYLRRVNGVSEVTKTGYRDREIHVDVRPKDMDKYNISLNDIVSSIQNRNIRSTGGTIQSINETNNIVTIGQFDQPLDVKHVIIRSGFEQRRVYVDTIADVHDSFEDENIRVKVNNTKSVILDIQKKENADIITTVNNIKKFIAENKEKYSTKFTIETVIDDSLSIRSLLDVVKSNAVIGFILVFIILFVFLDLQTSIWTAMGIPISLLIVLTYMKAVDLSLNTLSLGAIITVMGMLVDHGIVIAEEIYENRVKGMKPVEATIKGIKSVLSPVTVTILTTIFAFLPMLYIPGMMGKFIYIYPVIITITLAASYLEATIILPSHLSHIKPDNKKKKSKDWFKGIAQFYRKGLEKILRLRYLVITIFIIFLVGTVCLSRNSIKNFILFYDNSSEFIFITMEAPRGSNLNKTEMLVSDIEKKVFNIIPEKERLAVQTTIGDITSSPLSSKGDEEHYAEIKIILVPANERKRMAEDYVRLLKKQINISYHPGFDNIIVQEKKSGPPTGSPINIKIISSNDNEAVAIQKKLEVFLSSTDGVIDIQNDRNNTKKEYKIDLNYQAMADLGLTVTNIAQTIRTAYEGTIATSLQTLSQKIDFRVKVNDKYHKSKTFLTSLLIPNPQGRLVRLGDVAKIKTQTANTTINHYNGDRVITISANIERNKTTSIKVTNAVKKHFSTISIQYPNSYIVYGGESKKTSESLHGLGSAFIIAILLIYFVLIILFKSFSQPILIVLTIPFGIIGALLAFSAHGIPLSFMGIIGMIGLSGVVINDSIIMVEFINRVFKENKDTKHIHKAIAQGAEQRLRPVLLTTITTVAGLLPTVYGIGGDARVLVPTVMALTYGILFATLITLILVPSIYLINVDLWNKISVIKSWFRNILHRLYPQSLKRN